MAQDLYGGVDIGGTLGATGFFRLGQYGDRKVFVTPLGNPYILKGAYNSSYEPPAALVSAKYAGSKWVFWDKVTARMAGIGLNALGSYSSKNSWPVDMNARPTARAAKLPFSRSRNPELYEPNHSYGCVNIIRGVPTTLMGGFGGRSLPDVFHPNWRNGSRIRAYVNDVNAPNRGDFAPGSWPTVQQLPWMLAHTMGDRDNLFGFRTIAEHWHFGWGCLVTAPTQVVETVTMACHSKIACRDFLRAKYGTVNALNAAWGSAYTSWDSAGGYGVGTGVMDENGIKGAAWLGTFRMVGANANARADLDAFMEPFVQSYCLGWRMAMQAELPHHLLYGPLPLKASHEVDAFHRGWAGPNGPDVIEYQWADSAQAYVRAYNLTGKPFTVWSTYLAPQDSDKTGGWGAGIDFPTQEARGQAHANEMARLSALVGADGLKPFLGFQHWSWGHWKGEAQPFGIVDLQDNRFDGVQSTPAATPTTDEIGSRRLPSTGDFGDFVTAFRQANAALDALLGQDTTPPVAPAALHLLTASFMEGSHMATGTWTLEVESELSASPDATAYRFFVDGTAVPGDVATPATGNPRKQLVLANVAASLDVVLGVAALDAVGNMSTRTETAVHLDVEAPLAPGAIRLLSAVFVVA